MHTSPPAPDTAGTLIEQGIAAARSGDQRRAYDLLSRALAADPRDERGWLWLSGVVASDAERYYCLEQVLVINPGNAAARHGLSLLSPGVAPTSPLPPHTAPATDTTANLARFGLSGQDVAASAEPAMFAPPPEDAPQPEGAPQLPSSQAGADAPGRATPEEIAIVVRELGAGRTVDDVSRMLCERHGYVWPEAQRLALEVSARHRTTIARRQAPFLIFLGLATLVGGLALIGFAAMRYAYPPEHILSLPRHHARIVGSLFGGVVLVLGALLGLAQVIRSMWK